jgi:hypothetical protein
MKTTLYLGATNISTWPYYGGLSIFDGTTFTSFLEGSSPLPHKQVEDLEIDDLGNLWILCQSEGIAVYNPNGVKGFECIDHSIQMGVATSAEEIISQENKMSLIAYPNPFSLQTTLSIAVSEPGNVKLNLLDLSGRNLHTIFNGNLSAGNHEISFNRENLPQGIYLCELTTSEKTTTIKLFIQ